MGYQRREVCKQKENDLFSPLNTEKVRDVNDGNTVTLHPHKHTGPLT